jgi:hypothetical protein
VSNTADFVPGAYFVHDQLHVRGGHQTAWTIDGVEIPNTNIASNLGSPTEVRTKLLGIELRRGYAHPSPLHYLARAISSCWCPSVLDMVLTTVAQIPTWSEYEAQFFAEFTRMIAQKVRPENLPAIEQAASQARTQHGRSVLQLWATQAPGTRVGLSTLVKAPTATESV